MATTSGILEYQNLDSRFINSSQSNLDKRFSDANLFLIVISNYYCKDTRFLRLGMWEQAFSYAKLKPHI